MKSGSERFQFRIAQAADGPELLEILEENDFKGRIGLMYTRRPDPYRSFQLEGKDTVVVICRDTRENKMVGFGAFTVRKLYIDGEAAEVGYLFGLRSRKEYRGKYPLLSRGYQYMGEFITRRAIPFHLTTILEENRFAQKLLEKKRPFMPGYLPLTRYGTFVFRTGKRVRIPEGYTFRQAGRADIPRILQFLNTQGKRSRFFPVMEADCFVNRFPGLGIEDFWILGDGGNKIAACGAAWDQRDYKQYLLKEYRGTLKAIRPLTAIFKLFGGLELPKPGSILKFFTLSFWAANDNNPGTMELFLNLISAQVKNYPFFVVGCSLEHPLRPAIQRLSSLSYWSKVYLVDWDKDGQAAAMDKSSPVYLECGLL